MSQQNAEGNKTKEQEAKNLLKSQENDQEGQQENREISEAERTKINKQIENQRKTMIKEYNKQSEVLEAKIRYMENVVTHHKLSKEFNEIMKEQQGDEQQGEG